MAKQTFTTGQVLTAAQMTSLQQTAMGGGSPSTKTASYVLVAADAGTVIQMNAAGSTTITVNTALFSAGDSVQIQNIGAGVCTITAGTATVNTAGSLALSQWEGGFLYFTSASSAIFFDVVQSSGMTNPMTTAGDTIYGGASGTPTRLAIGSTGQVLTVSGGNPVWATASSGGMTSLASGSLSGASLDLTSISGSYQQLKLFLRNSQFSSAGTEIRVRLNNLSTGIYNAINNFNSNGTAGAAGNVVATSFYATYNTIAASTTSVMMIDVFDYVNTTAHKQVQIQFNFTNNSSQIENTSIRGACRTTNAIDRITVFPDAGTFNAGTYELFGVK